MSKQLTALQMLQVKFLPVSKLPRIQCQQLQPQQRLIKKERSIYTIPALMTLFKFLGVMVEYRCLSQVNHSWRHSKLWQIWWYSNKAMSLESHHTIKNRNQQQLNRLINRSININNLNRDQNLTRVKVNKDAWVVMNLIPTSMTEYWSLQIAFNRRMRRSIRSLMSTKW